MDVKQLRREQQYSAASTERQRFRWSFRRGPGPEGRPVPHSQLRVSSLLMHLRSSPVLAWGASPPSGKERWGDMKARIVQIGNSRGIRIPKPLDDALLDQARPTTFDRSEWEWR